MGVETGPDSWDDCGVEMERYLVGGCSLGVSVTVSIRTSVLIKCFASFLAGLVPHFSPPVFQACVVSVSALASIHEESGPAWESSE